MRQTSFDYGDESIMYPHGFTEADMDFPSREEAFKLMEAERNAQDMGWDEYPHGDLSDMLEDDAYAPGWHGDLSDEAPKSDAQSIQMELPLAYSDLGRKAKGYERHFFRRGKFKRRFFEDKRDKEHTKKPQQPAYKAIMEGLAALVSPSQAYQNQVMSN